MAVAQKILHLIRLSVRDKESPVRNMYFQAEASIHVCEALPISTLSKT